MNAPKRQAKKIFLGVGLDNDDGHVRITSGENFLLVSGSEETHGVMQEKATKLNEELKRRNKTLDMVAGDELSDIAESLGMRPLDGGKG